MNRALSKEYLLCCMNDKGNIRYTSNIAVCFTAACIVELCYKNYIYIKEGNVHLLNDLKDEDNHLLMMYQYIRKSGIMKLDSIINRYNFSVNDQEFTLLLSGVKEQLMKEMKLITVRKNTIFDKKVYYVANDDIVKEIIKQNKIDLLMNNNYGYILAALLSEDKNVKKYYSEKELFNIKNIKKKHKENIYINIINESVNNFILQIVAIISAFTISTISILYLNIAYIH